MSIIQGSRASEVDDPVIPIGVIAQKVGLSPSAVRKYEDEGLIITHRTGKGRRLFSYEDISRLRNIQHMIQDLGLNMEGIRRVQALLPCWNLLHCGSETRVKCPAYQASTRPCWMVKRRECGVSEGDCRRCMVYRVGSLCTEEIKCLMHEEACCSEHDAAASELLRRFRGSQGED